MMQPDTPEIETEEISLDQEEALRKEHEELEKKKKASKSYFVKAMIPALLCVGILLFFLFYDSNVQTVFPMWEPAEELPGNPDVTYTISDFQYNVKLATETVDQFTISVESKTGEEVTWGNTFQVDYFYEGQWYTVYKPQQVAAELEEYLIQENVSTFSIPVGLFDINGEFRLYVEGLGYCDVVLPQNSQQAA